MRQGRRATGSSLGQLEHDDAEFVVRQLPVGTKLVHEVLDPQWLVVTEEIHVFIKPQEVLPTHDAWQIYGGGGGQGGWVGQRVGDCRGPADRLSEARPAPLRRLTPPHFAPPPPLV